MLLERKHKCEFCEHNFTWFYLVPQMIGTKLDIEEIPENKTWLYRVGETVDYKGYRYPVSGTVYCPECGRLNSVRNIELPNNE